MRNIICAFISFAGLLNLLAVGYSAGTYLFNRPPCVIAEPVCPSCVDAETCALVDTPGANTTTLADAIEAANNSDATMANPFVIAFEVTGAIEIDEELESLKKPVCINGFTDEAAEAERTIAVEIEGDGVVANGIVLAPTAMGSTIKGIAIGNFAEINIDAAASGSLIAGNNVGLRADGLTPFDANTTTGIKVSAGSRITIGGVVADAANVIASVMTGIDIQANNITVLGNLIGTDATGTVMIGNTDVGIRAAGNFNCVGMPLDTSCSTHQSGGKNVIAASGTEESGDTQGGIIIVGSHNVVTNTFVGTDITGSAMASSGNRVGIQLTGAYNTIYDVVVTASINENIRLSNAHHNTVIKSLIGTNSNGAVGSVTPTSILLERSLNNNIARNIIGSLGVSGITVFKSSNNFIRYNRIGAGICREGIGARTVGILLCDSDLEDGCIAHVLADSTALDLCLPLDETGRWYCDHDDDVYNVMCDDICPDPKPNKSVGPYATRQNNIEHNHIAANTKAGIFLLNVKDNVIKYNLIGDQEESGVRNNGFGIIASNGTQNNLICTNVIAHNNFNGILIGPLQEEPESVPFNNTLLSNSIFNNGESGIKLFEHGNRCLAAPCLTSASRGEKLKEVWVTGFFNDPCYPHEVFTIQFFANDTCRDTISEGQDFIANRCVATDDCGFASFMFKLPLPNFAAECVSATATRIEADAFAQKDTSEYSSSIAICS